jgi:hypothetical protein
MVFLYYEWSVNKGMLWYSLHLNIFKNIEINIRIDFSIFQYLWMYLILSSIMWNQHWSSRKCLTKTNVLNSIWVETEVDSTVVEQKIIYSTDVYSTVWVKYVLINQCWVKNIYSTVEQIFGSTVSQNVTQPKLSTFLYPLSKKGNSSTLSKQE